MSKYFLYISVLFVVSLSSFYSLYGNNDNYGTLLKNENQIFNIKIDSIKSNKNTFELMSIYLGQNSRRKVFLVPSYEIYKTQIRENFLKHKDALYFIIITPNVSKIVDYTSIIANYNTNKYNILKKIDYSNSSIVAFIGYRGFIFETKLK